MKLLILVGLLIYFNVCMYVCLFFPLIYRFFFIPNCTSSQHMHFLYFPLNSLLLGKKMIASRNKLVCDYTIKVSRLPATEKKRNKINQAYLTA